MDRFWLLVLLGTLAYWIGGCAIWIIRGRAAIRQAAGTWVETGRSAATLEVKGQVNLLTLAAWAVVPPIVFVLVLRIS